MRLLNTNTLEFAEFFDSDIPAYAILSHRWQDEELSFRDMKPKHRASIEKKKGYLKVKAFAERALHDGHQYGWIDTICIDKRSSAELSEAINSMYYWYARAAMCYAYLHDVPHDQPDRQRQSVFTNSVYWRRCWLLQELLAPREILFLDDNWHDYDWKTELQDKKMSWAANREAARVEDVAYSLMGIFDVNMPLLYGEGGHAFLRLQKEIIARTNDHTIFAWTSGPGLVLYPNLNGRLLAESPTEFAGFRAIVEQYPDFDPISELISVTSWGLQMTTSLVTFKRVSSIDKLPSPRLSRMLFLPFARCSDSAKEQEHLLALPVMWYEDILTLNRWNSSLAVCSWSKVPFSKHQYRDCEKAFWSVSLIHPENGFGPKLEVEMELGDLPQRAANHASEPSYPHYKRLCKSVLSAFGKKSRRYSAGEILCCLGDPKEVKMFV